MTSFLRRLPGGPLTKAVALLGALVVLGGAAWIAYAVLGPDPACGQGIEERGPDGRKECTGVTDGSFVFADNLAAVSARIKAENERVRDEPHVSVAVMLPMTAAQPFEQRKTLHEVQGAYLAQYRANHDSNSKKPAIRLLLANPAATTTTGAPSPSSSATCPSPARTTCGPSSASTSPPRPPRRPSPTSPGNAASPSSAGPSPPTTSATAPPGRTPTPASPGWCPPPPTRPAPCPTSTRTSTRSTPSSSRTSAPGTTTSTPSSGPSPNGPRDRRGPRAVPRARRVPRGGHHRERLRPDGRHHLHLARPGHLLRRTPRPAAAVRQRTRQPGLHREEVHRHHRLRRLHPLLRRPPRLGRLPQGRHPPVRGRRPPRRLDEPRGPRHRRLGRRVPHPRRPGRGRGGGDIGEVELTDSRTITFYDAGLTAITAIRMRDDSDPVIPALGRIGDAWLRLHGMGKVEGASGWICLDNYGNPYNKAVSVVELSPDAPGRIRFVGLAWPTGRPTPADCTASRT
ncbi:hypothetical protein ACFQ60_09480 [Streptomyces zhihengii]